MENIYCVANYFLHKDTMTHKKLQKLCYFAQAWYLANYDVPLVPNRFEAWVHGPVSPDLYYRYRDWGWESIPREKEETTFENPDTSGFLKRVFDVYGEYDADTLENITHKEEPWIKARRGCQSTAYCRNPISQNDMKRYYGGRLGKHYESNKVHTTWN